MQAKQRRVVCHPSSSGTSGDQEVAVSGRCTSDCRIAGSSVPLDQVRGVLPQATKCWGRRRIFAIGSVKPSRASKTVFNSIAISESMPIALSGWSTSNSSRDRCPLCGSALRSQMLPHDCLALSPELSNRCSLRRNSASTPLGFRPTAFRRFSFGRCTRSVQQRRRSGRRTTWPDSSLHCAFDNDRAGCWRLPPPADPWSDLESERGRNRRIMPRDFSCAGRSASAAIPALPPTDPS